MDPIRILLVDDHRIITDGLLGLLTAVPDMTCVGTCVQGAEALEALRHVAVDVVLMDIDMPVLDGIGALERIVRDHPHVKVIMLSMHDEPAMVQRVLHIGAAG